MGHLSISRLAADPSRSRRADKGTGARIRALALSAALGALLLVAGGSLSQAPAAGCVANTAISPARDVCITGVNFVARGWLDATCFERPAKLGDRYPFPGACGIASKRKQIEYIAQSRFISRLGYMTPGNVATDVQWEIQLGTRADVSRELNGRAQLYEAKLTSNPQFTTVVGGMTKVVAQVKTYQQLMIAKGAPTDLGQEPFAARYADVFLVGTGSKCLVPGTTTQVNGNDVYFSWLIRPGVLAVHKAPVPCFDAERVKVPLPALEDDKVDKPIDQGEAPSKVDVPYGLVGDVVASPIPNTTMSTGADRLPDPVTAPAQDTSGISPLASAGSGGDPHMRTFDGLAYDFQAAGEFQLVEGDGVNIQARTDKAGSGASVIGRLAFGLGDHVVDIDAIAPRLRIDGDLVSLESGKMLDFGDGSKIVRSANRFIFTWPGVGQRPALQIAGYDARYHVPPDRRPVGLLGDGDGNPSNDLMLSDGTRLPATSSPSAIHGTLADSWRVTDDDSLFTYDAGQSTATFTDRTFPETVISLGDYSDEVLAEATAHCTEAKVPDGRAFENCLLDWAVTRDLAFVEAAADNDQPSIEAGARSVDADGVVTENFESSVAPNFSALRYGTGAGTGRFAGPFARDGRYSASVGTLPGHEAATLQFDLITLGTWPTDNSNPVTVTTGGTQELTVDVASRTPAARGTTAGGQPYAVYPVTLKRVHSDDQLTLGVSAKLPLGSTHVFGVDNIRLALDLVAPEAFDVSLPLQVPRTSMPGAGQLETIGSQDTYRLARSTSGAVQVDLTGCTASLSWTLVGPDRATVATGPCGSKRTPVLGAGTYELSLAGRGSSGTYRLALFDVPPAQRFSVTLPIVAGDGVPGEGAGRLETTASEDHYEFSTTAAGGIVIDFSDCSTGFDAVTWRLVRADSGIVSASGRACDSTLVPNVSAGRLRLEVASNGKAGTYAVSLESQPAPQIFTLTLPSAVRDGSPTGAGNLETTASQDAYLFETSAAGGLVIELSACSSSLGRVTWRLTGPSGATVRSEAWTCGSAVLATLPAGQYRLTISQPGRKGTYALRVLQRPSPEEFALSLPAAVQDGTPAAGAGNLETAGSEDRYAFTTSAAGSLQIDLSDCSAGCRAGSCGRSPTMPAAPWRPRARTGCAAGRRCRTCRRAGTRCRSHRHRPAATRAPTGSECSRRRRPRPSRSRLRPRSPTGCRAPVRATSRRPRRRTATSSRRRRPPPCR